MNTPEHSSIARSRFRKTGALVLGCTCAALLAAACGGSTAASSNSGPTSGGHGNGSGATPGHPTTVTFETDYLPNGKYAPFVYGKSLGYFKQQGINLEIKYGHGSGLTSKAVAAGRVDIGMVDSGVTALSVGKGEPIKSVGLYLAKNDFAFFVPKKSSITKISDLKGKRLIVSPGTPQAIVAPAVLKRAGLDNGAVKFVSLSPDVADSGYAHGKGDAIGEAVTFAPVFQNIRPSRALPWISVGYRIPGFSFVVKKTTLSEKPQVVANFLKATYKSMDAALKNPDAAIGAYAKSQPTLPKGKIGPEWTSLTPFFCSDAAISAKKPLGFQMNSDWKNGISILEQAAGLKKSVTPDAVYTNELFKKYHVSHQTCTSKWGGPFKGGSGK
jgi:NitT/TauT family transport system substrate-binding protein